MLLAERAWARFQSPQRRGKGWEATSQPGAERLAARHRIPTFRVLRKPHFVHMLSTDQALLTEEQSWHQRAILGALQAIRKPPPILGLLEVCGRRICPQRGAGADFAIRKPRRNSSDGWRVARGGCPGTPQELLLVTSRLTLVT